MNDFAGIERVPFYEIEPNDFASIGKLEEKVIPWQNEGHGPPTRPSRREATRYPLFAAEDYFRRSARTGAQSIDWESHAPSAAEFARQNEQFLAWAQRRGRLIDRSFEDRLDNLGGVEHEVFFDDATHRWLKLTMPGRAGKEMHAEEDMNQARPRLVTGDALPSSYLRRLALANRRLGDDYWLHGVIAHPAGPRLVVSQRPVHGYRPSSEQIVDYFQSEEFRVINDKTFYHPLANLLISDAHDRNVFTTDGGMALFDVCVQHPRGALLRAVEYPPDLNFEDEREEQGALIFE